MRFNSFFFYWRCVGNTAYFFLHFRPNGLILYNGQNSNGNGDFLSINLVDGYVQLRYDLGSGVANLTSPERAPLGEWNSLKVTRNGPFGTLQLNTGQLVTGMSPGSLTELNLELPLYLGGYKYVFDKYPKFLLWCIFFFFFWEIRMKIKCLELVTKRLQTRCQIVLFNQFCKITFWRKGLLQLGYHTSLQLWA